METKICSRCGETRPISMFRKYYGERKGEQRSTYKFCKVCESIEARRKYIVGLGERASEDQQRELDDILKLYECRKALGLDVPTRRGVNGRVTASVQDQLATLEARLSGNT